MKRYYSVLLLIFCFMAPSLTFAGDTGMYGTLKLGLFMPNSDFHGDSWGGNTYGYNFDGMSGFDNVPLYGVSFGMLMNPNVALEIGWETYETELDIDFHNLDTSNYKIKTWSVPITAKLLMPVSNQITAFFGAGLGYYDAEVDATETLNNPATNPYGIALGTSSDTQASDGFGLHAVAGADFKVDANLSFGLELKWSNAKLDFDDFTFFGAPYYMDRDTNVGGTSLSLTAKYSF